VKLKRKGLSAAFGTRTGERSISTSPKNGAKKRSGAMEKFSQKACEQGEHVQFGGEDGNGRVFARQYVLERGK